jgi:uncharacterized protein (TIRG00374 family)
MRNYRNQILAGLLFISVALIAVVALTGVDALAGKLETFPLWLFIPVLLLKCVNWGLRYLEWRTFLRVIGVHTVWEKTESSPVPSIRERDSLVLWLSGLAMAVSPGKLAEMLKALILKSLSGSDFSRNAPVVFMERLVDGFAVIILAVIALLTVGGSLSDGVAMSTVRLVLISVAAVLIVGTAIIQYRRLSLALLAWAGRLPLLRRIETILRNLYDSTYELLRLKNLALPLLFGLGAHFSDCIGFYLLLTGLGIDGSLTLFGQAMFVVSFAVIVASLSAMPGGAGGRELTAGAILTGVIGLSKTDAGTGTFLLSILQSWLGVLLGLVIIALFRQVLFPPSLEDEISAYEAKPHPGEVAP